MLEYKDIVDISNIANSYNRNAINFQTVNEMLGKVQTGNIGEFNDVIVMIGKRSCTLTEQEYPILCTLLEACSNRISTEMESQADKIEEIATRNEEGGC